jgi:16S rRNA (adenine1518-N6/adenine1519-N6)-dimethyltransferase
VRPLVDPAGVRDILRAARLRARHELSQNFLTDVAVLEGILDEASPEPGGRVLEIGPGLGILTGGLLAGGAALTAVELDRGLVGWLRRRFGPELDRSAETPGAPGSLRLIEGDILDQDLATLIESPFDVVANLPYHITSPVLHRVLSLARPPRRLVLMVQREVAERIAAPPGGLSYLSVFVQYHARARIAFLVPRGSFEPEPAVESAVLVLEPRVGWPGRLDAEGEEALWRLVMAAFRERRKMLHNVLARQLPMEVTRLRAALDATGIDPDRRPQTVSVDEWLALLAVLGPLPPDRRGHRTADSR